MKLTEVNKLFTVEDASELLPELSVMIDEFRDRKNNFLMLNDEVIELRKIVEVEEYRKEELNKKERVLKATAAELENLILQINNLGCHLKDPETGLVDFISLYKGKKVFLCWRQGEEEITWYHDINSGFAGRKMIEFPEEFKNHSAE